MMDKINTLIQTFDNCTLGTKIIMLLALIVIAFVSWQLIVFIVTTIKSGFKAETLLNFIQRLVKIIIPLEFKSIAGLINLLLTICLLIVTVLVFLSASLSGMLGFSENVSINKLILIFLTVFVAGISFWALYKFDKESKMITNGSA